jgi:hypothetical protein
VQKAEEAKAAAEAEESEREAARLALLRKEYEAAIPDEIRDRVQAAVDKELVRCVIHKHNGPAARYNLDELCAM